MLSRCPIPELCKQQCTSFFFILPSILFKKGSLSFIFLTKVQIEKARHKKYPAYFHILKLLLSDIVQRKVSNTQHILCILPPE